MSQKKYVKTPTIFQMEATECGAASLAMILAYFGCNVPLEKIRIDTGISRNGSTAKNLYYAAENYGLEVKGYSKSLENMLKLPLPCILHWNFNHFVVFEGIKGKYAYLNDPAQGRRKITMEELKSGFTGVVLTFKPGPNFKKTSTDHKNSHFAVKKINSEKNSMIALIIMGLLLVVPGIVIPLFSQIFIDDILIKGMSDWLLPLLVAMLLTVAFSVTFKILRSRIMIKLQSKMSLISAYKFQRLMFSLPIPFFEQRYAGDLSERVKNNNKVNEFLTGDLGQSVLDIFVAIFYLILMFIYSVQLTFVVIGFTLITVVYGLLASRALESISKKAQQDAGKLVGVLYSGLLIRDTIKASGAENNFVSRILGFNANVEINTREIGRIQNILKAVPNAISNVANIVVLTIGGIMVIRGKVTPGILVAFVQLMTAFSAPIISISSLFEKIQSFKADVARVEDIERYPVSDRTNDRDSDNLSEYDKLNGLVEFRGVDFGYSKLEPAIITDFTFKLEPGESVALVGPSGCGKSTVGKLVSGLTRQWKGDVLIDGKTIDQIPQDAYTESVSTVSQDITLFSGTIKENLTLWNSMVMEQDIIAAAKDACIHDAITMLPGGYDHLLDEGGTNLSGGQRQRIEIARALVTNPSILIMDEATSALDPLVEKQIMDNIRRRGCSLIIVAHRLSTIRDCDEILVMKQGSIIERGTHEELIKQQGIYKDLINNA